MIDVAFARHLSDRLGFGPRAGDLGRIVRMGADRWIEEQLYPEKIALPAGLSARLGSLTNMRLSATEAFTTYGPPLVKLARGAPDPAAVKTAFQKARVISAEAAEARILRAVYSPRQLEETLVEFWFNHFNVFGAKGLDRIWVSSYEQEAIRPHVLGRFRDMLGATAAHPAMAFYLDNWLNTAPESPGARGRFQGLNENYARELLELHTLGVDGGYIQDDIVAVARVFTGWGFGGRGGNGADGMAREKRPLRERVKMGRELKRSGGFIFAENRHDFADKVVLGRTVKGRGVEEGHQVLDLLARHPATARHISFKLAQYFLADRPDPAVVEAMTAKFQASDGDIRATVRVLFAAREFRDAGRFGTKFKTPHHFVLSALRASGATVHNVLPAYGILMQLGQPIYGCQTPDGYKCTQAVWLNPDAMTRRITFAIALASGNLPLDVPRLETFAAQRQANAAARPSKQAKPIDPAHLLSALGTPLSPATGRVVEGAPEALKASLILGSPEFMRC